MLLLLPSARLTRLLLHFTSNLDVDTRSFSEWVKKLKKGNREKTQTQTASDKPPDTSEQGSKKNNLIQTPPQVQSNNTVNGSQSGFNRNAVFGGGDSSDGAPIPKQKATTSSGTTSRKPKQINKPTRTDHDQSAMKIALAQAKGLFPRMGRRFRREIEVSVPEKSV